MPALNLALFLLFLAGAPSHGSLAKDPTNCPSELIHTLESSGATALLDETLGLVKKPRARSFQTEWDYFLAGLAAEGNPLQTQRQRMRDFGRALAEARTGEEQAGLRNLLEALRLVDYPHAAPSLMQAFLSGSERELLTAGIPDLYDHGDGPSRSVFEAYRKAKKFIEVPGLTDPKAPFHLEQLLEIHRLAMRDGLPGRQLGAVRREAIGAQVVLNHSEYLAVLKNEYLNFQTERIEETEGVASRVYYGWIDYPQPFTVKEQALARIESTHPELVAQIRAFKEKFHGNRNGAIRSRPFGQLTENLCRALSQERIERFNQYRQARDLPSTAEHLNDYVRATSDYYRDMISIHLLPDGNGRSLRHFSLYEPLKRVGLPRPRLRDPDADYLLAPGKWNEQIQKGILSNHNTYFDVMYRLKHQLPVPYSSELLFPDPPRDIHLTSRRHGKRAVERAGQLSAVDPRQFAAFVRLHIGDKQWRRAFAADPLDTMDQLREAFKDFTRQSHLFYTDKKGDRKEIGLIFIDADFRYRFGTATAHNPALWRRKLEESYAPDLVWRGIATLAEDPTATDEELQGYFSQFVPHLLSERIKAKSRGRLKADWVVKEANRDFERFNHELLGGSLWQTVLAHVSMTEGYASSNGFSTSKNFKTGELFAMGHLVVCAGEENCRKQSFQKDIAQRVLVGVARADWYVDTNRLKLFSPDFSSQYPRQAEVLGAGAQDPETVLIVQVLDNYGEPIRSWVRNPQQPSQIWVIDGDYRDKLKPWPQWQKP